ncbi:MAG: maleylpyruvate isomerase family mycothiol-dependent enzyme [Actinomycetota bacterium]|nr:maleylpyruvate isomerase family mycothiol-dependent enzyme [Actinomycetota bacterium]MDQ6947273.1 maleylpyruvate isomerase family mycothiol-dependent enzyme [Actinomycetota bacterium]
MTAHRPPGQALEELRYALAEADTHRPPVALRSRVLESATSARPPGRAVGTGPAITALEGYRRTMASFDAVLSELTDAEWHTPVLRDLDIQGLLGHLIGVERHLHAALEIGPPVPTSTDHVASTQDHARAQAGRPPSRTHAEWLDITARTIAHVATLDGEARERQITLHNFTASIDRILVVRLFETWTHEEDVRRATNRPLAAPDAARLRLMTELAVAALPKGLEIVDRPQPGRTARIVLTGPGGGTWQASLDRRPPGPTDVRIIVDATSFCRLVANRMEPVDLGADISGDEALGADLLVGAQALALD